jgi:type I restriction enzyme M protein
MNKQQLAAKIWESANQMRSKIEANEYKDYILGFIFYKYLCDTQEKFALSVGYTKDDIKALSEDDEESVAYFKDNIGFFISYENLFSTWIFIGKDFDVSDVRRALSAFSRLIHKAHKKLFDGIFNTLETGLSKLGDSSASQTKSISKLIHLIKDIPMNSKQDYDVLGFIYEYLISMFAATAGKKAGEFYTPHEVSVLMSEIIAHELQDKKEIQIYDPTSGSGSLLINIGNSLAKHIDDENNIKYYAQELKQNTYNLTRMNLIMRGILPNNIETRNSDTLEEDWPRYDESDPLRANEPLYLDAVVSNPPYSQKWEPEHKESDPRYSFGLAPKTKADYAFLLHDLYHLKPHGIMTIVLPHGVLFRGGEEAEIRKNLIEQDHIEAIIGLPANIFFGTGIPTVIIVLKQQRDSSDILIIDASKGYEKVGKNNKLRAKDIKKIIDTIISKKTIPKYSKLVEKQTIRDNGYNLNIPRYVDSSADEESWDIYATMFGGIPKDEIDKLDKYYRAFESLKDDIFENPNSQYTNLKIDNIKDTIYNHKDIKEFVDSFTNSFDSFDDFLKKELLEQLETLKIEKKEKILIDDIFARLEPIALIDKYQAYGILNDNWLKIAVDIEIIQTEGFESTRVVDPNIVIKKKDGKDVEVQDGWIGHIMPFELVQSIYLSHELYTLRAKELRVSEISAKYDEIIESLSEEERDSSILNEKNDAFVKKEVASTLKDIYSDLLTPEIAGLKEYIYLLDCKANKSQKMEYIESQTEVTWSNIVANKDGTYGKKNVENYIKKLQLECDFAQDSYESKIALVDSLITEEAELRKEIRKDTIDLHLKTKDTIQSLSDAQVYELLKLKWIAPLCDELQTLPTAIVDELISKIEYIAKKYETTLTDIEDEINQTQKELSSMISELKGSEYDMRGLQALKELIEVDDE